MRDANRSNTIQFCGAKPIIWKAEKTATRSLVYHFFLILLIEFLARLVTD
jgi:hypothetical protein